MTASAGDAAIVLLVPEAEAVVRRWRLEFDPSAAEGVPAHVTVLGPFLPLSRITDETLSALASIAAATPALELVFERSGRFAGVLWLDPTASACLPLFTAVHQRWPECIPYGDATFDVVPHLTITRTADAQTMERIERELRRSLPFRATVADMTLLVFDGVRWVTHDRFPFAPREPDRWRRSAGD